MEAVCISETSVSFCRTARRYIPEGNKQRYFCDGMRRKAVPEFFSDDRKLERRSGTFPPGTGLTNTTLLRPDFGSLLASRNLLLKTVALAIIIFAAVRN
jgi:hypothetical protein